MIFFFEKSKRMFWALIICLAILFMMVFATKGQYINGIAQQIVPIFPFGIYIENKLLYATVWIVCALFVLIFPYCIAGKIANDEHKKIMSLILEQCNPDEFIRQYGILFHNRKINSEVRLTMMENLCLGYFGLNDYNRCLELLLPYVNNKPIHANMKTLYCRSILYNNICASFSKLGQPDQANNFYALFCEAHNALQKSKKYSALSSIMSKELCHRIHFDEIPVHEHIAYYEEAFLQREYNLHRINAKFHLGKLYLTAKDFKNAHESFAYIVNHGNKLKIVDEAKEFLQQLGEANNENH